MNAEELRQPGREVELLKVVRTIAAVSACDDRKPEDFEKSMQEILILTRHLGNEPIDFDWKFKEDT